MYINKTIIPPTNTILMTKKGQIILQKPNLMPAQTAEKIKSAIATWGDLVKPLKTMKKTITYIHIFVLKFKPK